MGQLGHWNQCGCGGTGRIPAHIRHHHHHTTTTTDLIGGTALKKVGLIIPTLGSWLESHSGHGLGVYQTFCHVYIVPLSIVVFQLANVRAIMSYRVSKYDS